MIRDLLLGNPITADGKTPSLDFVELWQQALRPVAPNYTVATLPSAGQAGEMVFVSDEAGGAVLAFSDGAAWRRVTDRAVVS